MTNDHDGSHAGTFRAGASGTDTFDHASDKARREASGAESGMEAQLEDLTAGLRENARNVAEQQKSAGADRLAELGHAVHGAARGLEQELPQAAQLVHSAAANIEGASTRLRERSVDDLLGMFSSFARRQPAAAFAGAVLAGFALSRFLKSSRVERRGNA